MATQAEFEDATPLLADPPALRQRMDMDGFLFFRGLVPRGTILDLRRQILLICQRNGWLAAETPLMDAIISPAGARPPERFDSLDSEAAHRVPNYTNAFNLTGLPAMSVPCGFTPEGLPIGLQIVARHRDDWGLLQMAHAFERAGGFVARAF